MKLKQVPEDFLVREMDELRLDDRGEYAIYTLQKRGIGTIEAVGIIAREFKVDRRDIGFGGLKDKWAVTEQAISIRNGPRQELKQPAFTLTFLGMSATPVGRNQFEENEFRITLRDLSEGDRTHLARALHEIRHHGLPNYFDSQRFGSARGGNEFIAKRLILGDFEGALKLAIATPTPEDRSRVRKTKQLARDHWGQWGELVKQLKRNMIERRIAGHLRKHPADFAHAFELLDHNLRRLYVSAYQSYLWNLKLMQVLRDAIPESELFRKKYEMGELLFYHTLESKTREKLAALEIPYHTHQSEPDEILKAEGIEPSQLKLKGLRSTYFSKGRRPAIVFPKDLGEPEISPDDLNPGKSKAALTFKLPRGSYATVLVKRIFH